MPFYQEVIDALAANNHADLVLLRDIGVAVDADDKTTGGSLVDRLLALSPGSAPLNAISTDFYFELVTRVLLLGWFREFRLLMDWYRPAGVSTAKNQALIANWAGVMSRIVEPAPGIPLEDLVRAFMRHLNALKCAFADLGKLDVPPPPPPPPAAPPPGTKPPPPPPPAQPPPPTLESQLRLVVEQVVRVLHMLFQQLLEFALRQLELDRTSNFLRRVQRLHDRWREVLNEQDKLPDDKKLRALHLRIRTAEIRYRRPPKERHRFVDAFRPKTVRSVEFETFDRTETGKPEDKRAFLSETVLMRSQQIGFYAHVYGVPLEPGKEPDEDEKRRQELIDKEYRNQLKIRTDDDLIRFLVSLFKSVVKERIGPPLDEEAAKARGTAWLVVLKFLERYLERLTAHTRFNIWDRDPSYLTLEFPRAVFGGLVHDCGVYAVRMAYILLSLAQAIDRTDKHAFDMQASWILLPLHVGLLVRTNLGVLIVHNNALFVFSETNLDDWRDEWTLSRDMTGDVDPADENASRQKFLEDVAATAFNPDVDTPLLRFDVIGRGTLATKKSVWASYRRRMREERLFTKLVAAARAPQFQFDLHYIRLSSLQRAWYNSTVVPFWNERCKKIWEAMLPLLDTNFKDNKAKYADLLQEAVNDTVVAYRDVVLPDKQKLNAVLRAHRNLLQKGVRTTFSERLEDSGGSTGPVGTVLEHIEEVKMLTELPRDPKTKRALVPVFARADEELQRLPD